MKLIFCTECQDVRKITATCACGKSKGVYHSDGWNVTVSGPCIVLGISNTSLQGAIHLYHHNHGADFDAFTILDDSPRIHRR